MEKYFERYNKEISYLKDLFKNTDYHYIARFSYIDHFSCSVTDNETLSKQETETVKFGLHVFTKDGGAGFATSDLITEEAMKSIFDLGVNLAKSSEKYDKTDMSFFSRIKPLNKDFYPEVKYPKSKLSSTESEKKLYEIQKEVSNMLPDFSITSSIAITEQHWRIIRDDGTDTSFLIPKSVIASFLTYRKDGKTSSMLAKASATGYDFFYEKAKKDLFFSRVRMEERLSRDVIDAPEIVSGSYRLLIDYPLAKGLAHEAFGHATESDHSHDSILFNDKAQFRKNEKVASDVVNIIEESIEGDYAYQPVSANGVIRDRVQMVKDGVLLQGLGDIFSAEKSGMNISGAGRATDASHMPIPRMTNIRLEVNNPEPIEKTFEDILPEDIYQILDKKGVLDEAPVIYMTGYKGGQVNPKYGDFVFNCSVMYKLEKDKPIEKYRPGIFSGKVLEALKSIKFGIGGTITDAIGLCGKHGQRVASSGGSNMFIFMDKSDYIKLGGKSND